VPGLFLLDQLIRANANVMTKRKLRIAQFVTSQRALPAPKGVIWAPIDLALEIADAMAERGHAMTFYAPPSPAVQHRVVSGRLTGGVCDAELAKFFDKERKARKMPFGSQHIELFDAYLIGKMIEDANRGLYDVLHFHHECALPFAGFSKVPMAVTLHDPINANGEMAYRLLNHPNAHLVSISMAQRRPAADLNWSANIYNGIDVGAFSFRANPKDKFLFCSRLIPQKGVEDAVAAAKLARAELDIVGLHYDSAYLRGIRKLCTSKVRYRGFVDRTRLPRVYGQAKALLFPIKWEEPFGLVMAEAMACGTPVIAYGRGSVPEIVKDGVSGFIVKTPMQMAAAMKKIDRIDRQECRAWAVGQFGKRRMVDDYERLYLKLANK
jgi:glycosyltransferase involved in cell wall biosynthesis